jgi:hypothetical protein
VKGSLPFPAETFDFVHIRFVARGVPESAWVVVFKVSLPQPIIKEYLTSISGSKSCTNIRWCGRTNGRRYKSFPFKITLMVSSSLIDIIFPKISIPWYPIGMDENQSTFFEENALDDTPNVGSSKTASPKKPKEHPHRLLEWLHDRLYDQEFISRRPTCQHIHFQVYNTRSLTFFCSNSNYLL